MSLYDGTLDDEPVDVAAVNADNELLEQLRHALSPDAAVIWDDDDDELDPALGLLRSLQRDVSADLPSESVLPPRITELLPRRRHLGRGATVALVTAGVLSIGGVAAASAPGQPLSGVRSAVSSAVSDVVSAITPDAPVGPDLVKPSLSPRPTVTPTPPGQLVSAAARSASAALQIEANLDRAERLLDDGRYAAAEAQLDAAVHKLPFLLPGADLDRLTSRLIDLQTRFANGPDPKASHKPDDKGAPEGKGKSASSSPRSDSSGRGSDPSPGARPTALPSGSARSGEFPGEAR
ncbi:MAG: hypothetical protein JJD92_11305 [Frankiaceae bacterium]|nr:hypothetical protein [Frankiaceae bacterium]